MFSDKIDSFSKFFLFVVAWVCLQVCLWKLLDSVLKRDSKVRRKEKEPAGKTCEQGRKRRESK